MDSTNKSTVESTNESIGTSTKQAFGSSAWLRRNFLPLAIALLTFAVILVDSYQNVKELPKKVVVEPVVNNEQILARVLISEASIGNKSERQAVGLTVINRMKKAGSKNVQEVVKAGNFYHYAIDQDPTLYPEYAELAKQLLAGKVRDFTGGATHFYSPYSMPKKGEKNHGFDCEGGFVRYTNPETNKPVLICTPSWSKTLRYIDLAHAGIRPYYFEFFAE
ncbi:cell wall hydrolase [Tumidithrix elongata RA019]|uniref:Cell wall hydrolase n=1 Tax=Tumidithrix elongata BACA0141 TaxID=2716417 RepID=A0AAW9PS98_9CYAN|nr:cell wall hydrolase [Tumidithrix elongata RA019]